MPRTTWTGTGFALVFAPEKDISPMPTLTRRRLVATGTAAGATLATMRMPALAQDDMPTVTVGSKNFTEGIILGEIVALLLEDNGYSVERQLNLGGTLVVHEALVNGDIDACVEYTGTGLLAVLGMELPEQDASATPAASASPEAGSMADRVYTIVSEEYSERFDLEWLEPWGFNNTYAIAMRADQAEELGISTISDLVEHAPDLVIGAPQETLVREDGIPGLVEAYGLDFQDAVGMEPDLIYPAIDNGEVDVITASATDSRIQSMGLVVLEDDKNFYPPYYAAPVVRQELLEAAPEVRDILNSVAGVIDEARMTELNLQAEGDDTEPVDVARGFLQEEGLIGGE